MPLDHPAPPVREHSRVCTCSGVAPTMPVFRDWHLSTCPMFDHRMRTCPKCGRLVLSWDPRGGRWVCLVRVCSYSEAEPTPPTVETVAAERNDAIAALRREREENEQVKAGAVVLADMNSNLVARLAAAVADRDRYRAALEEIAGSYPDRQPGAEHGCCLTAAAALAPPTPAAQESKGE